MHAATYHMTNLQPVRGYSDLDIVGLIDRLELALLTKQDKLDVALDKINKLIEQSRSETNGGMRTRPFHELANHTLQTLPRH